ncbi:MAG: AI-2E family transporter [Lachnospiraceae bacterium]|nr:AI-2E family transporter [Lachnospiraceae bacterium]
MWEKYRKEAAEGIMVVAVTTIAVYVGFRFLLPLFLPFLLALLFSRLLLPAVAFLKTRFRIEQKTGGIVVISVVTALSLLLSFGVIWLLIRQLQTLLFHLPAIFSRVEALGEQFGLEVLQLQRKDVADYIARLGQTATKEGQRFLMGFVRNVLSGIWVVFIVVLSTFFMMRDRSDLEVMFQDSAFSRESKKIGKKLSQAATAYGKSFVLNTLVVFVVCSVGLMLVKNRYSIVAGLGISLLDALPVLGSGMILLPLSAYYFFNGRLFAGVIMILLYLICELLKEMIETKVVRNKTGLQPVFTITAMYIGIKLFGIFGFVLGPMGLLLIRAIFHLWLEYEYPDN